MKRTPGRDQSFHHGITQTAVQVEPSVWAWPLGKPPKALEQIADVVLAYRPKPKSKAAKKRKRREKRAQTNP